MSDANEEEYILGTDQDELRRLGRQHQAWVEQMYALMGRTGVRDGDRMLDLGSGPGFTTFELAHLVGSRGHVLAVDESPRFIVSLAEEAARRGHSQVDGAVRKVEELGLQAESLDGVYGRWILSWLPDTQIVFKQVARALKPGGYYVLQEYLDWGAMKLLPASSAHASGIRACMASWEASDGFINAAQRVPEQAASAGLVVEHFAVNARSGGPGSIVWMWLDEFYRGYLPRLVERNLMDQAALASFFAAWDSAACDDRSIAVAPVMADIVVRRPLH